MIKSQAATPGLATSETAPVPPTPEDWQRRALIAEERLARLETILKELFSFARIGQ